MTCDNVKPLLNARLDEEVENAHRAALDSHLEGCSSCATELGRLKSVRNAIRGGMPYYRAPLGLQDRVRFALRGAEYLDRGARRQDWRAWGAVAATLALISLASVPFVMNARNRNELVAEDLLSAHERALVGRMVDVVSTDQHTVKPWFNGKLPFSPPVTDLSADGFPLEGGRLDFAGGHPVATLIYGRRLHRIDVFVWPLAGQTAPPAHFERDGFNEAAWTRNNFQFTAVSDLNASELKEFAGLLQTR
jgi:anti-sigma factor RsiW